MSLLYSSLHLSPQLPHIFAPISINRNRKSPMCARVLRGNSTSKNGGAAYVTPYTCSDWSEITDDV